MCDLDSSVGHMTEYLMAAHLVRWWKSKILSGYKQFTVLPSDCGADTEELLKASDDGPLPTTPPPPRPPSRQTHTTAPPADIGFDGFECDVSVEGNGDPSDRQEFSFTLYDFDGHGKITKDDIAGLVTTIYDTLGSSIKVPHYGSKTIKVKLTVSPDQDKDCPHPEPPAQPRRYKRDLNVTIRERRRRPLRRRHSVSSSAASEDREADVSEEEDEPHLHCRLHPTSCRANVPSGNLHSRSKKRSSSLQRQELLQIIQANMEKNNLCFKTSRKHHSPGHDPSRHKPHWDKCTRNAGRGRGKTQTTEIPPSTPPVPPRPVPTSPHHLKHRHREQEQARAMDQVVRWLEQEFTPPRDKSSRGHTRTEHHHVHEHVHHHYHHYQDTPVLV